MIEMITETGCWIWMGQLNHNGYGRREVKGRRLRAHRVAFGLDKIPKGMMVLHKCDVRCCVNPDHLYIGDNSTNMRDMIRRGRGKGQIPKGWNGSPWKGSTLV